MFGGKRLLLSESSCTYYLECPRRMTREPQCWVCYQTAKNFFGLLKLYWLQAGRSGDWMPVGGEIFRICPDRPWDPPSLLYNGYRVFSGGKERPECDAYPSPPSGAVGHERVELYLYSPYGPYGLYRASVPVQSWPLPLPFTQAVNVTWLRSKQMFSFGPYKSVTLKLFLWNLSRRAVIKWQYITNFLQPKKKKNVITFNTV